RAGSSAVLYGPANEPSPNRNARDGTGAWNDQGGATSSKSDDPRMLTVGTAFDVATGDHPGVNVGPMQQPTVFNNARPRAVARQGRSFRTGARRHPNNPEVAAP